jgi:hypothetical protein
MYGHGKMRPVETNPRNGGRGWIKENDGESQFNYILEELL